MADNFDARVPPIADLIDKHLPDAARARVVTENIAANILLAADTGGRPTFAALDVLAERRRQIEEEGFTPEHDDQHAASDMALAAACFAISGSKSHGDRDLSDKLFAAIQFVWPRRWAMSWWKPKDSRRDLVRAGALALAAIERIDRAAAKAETT